MFRKCLAIAIGFLLLGGTALAAEGQGQAKAIDISPFIDIKYKTAESTGLKPGMYSGCYTRLIISSKAPPDSEQQPEYSYSKIKSLIRKSNCAVSFSAKVTVRENASTAPLLTINHSNNDVGEKWERDVIHAKYNLPLFLIQENALDSTPELTLSFRGDKTMKTNATAETVELVSRAVGEISPKSQVFTSLSSNFTKKTTAMIDGLINRLFTTSLSEMNILQREIKTLMAGGTIEVTVKIPEKECKWSDQELTPIGTWVFSLSTPYPSLFSDWHICPNIAADVEPETKCAKTKEKALEKAKAAALATPNQVLGFTIAPGPESVTTIGAYLDGVAGLASYNGKFTGKLEEDRQTAKELCGAVVKSMTGIYLNESDAKIVANIVASKPHPKVAHKDAFTVPECMLSQ